MGPDRNATKAMGPVVAVATAIMPTAPRITASRVAPTRTPRAAAHVVAHAQCLKVAAAADQQPPNNASAPSRGQAWSSRAPFTLPDSSRIASCRSQAGAGQRIGDEAVIIADTPMPTRISRDPATPPRKDRP